MSFIPQNCDEEPPALPYEPGDEIRTELKDIVPENPNQPYDMKDVIEGIVDVNSFHEVHRDFAKTLSLDLLG